MDSTGYYGKAHQPNNYLVNNSQNFSQQSVDTYNDDQIYENKRPKSNYIGQNNTNQAKQRNNTGHGNQNPEPYNRSMIKQFQLGPVKDDAKKKMKNITGRTKPKHILHDPEALREEVFALNRRLVELKKSNGNLNSELE